MRHTTEIIKLEKLDQKSWVAVVRCCGDPKTDYPVTLAVSVLADPVKKAETLRQGHEQCAKNHEVLRLAAESISDSLGEAVEHDNAR